MLNKKIIYIYIYYRTKMIRWKQVLYAQQNTKSGNKKISSNFEKVTNRKYICDIQLFQL